MDTKALRQKILDLAIHGKLVPQDPNDEPASVLLERIRAEKERLIKEGKIKKEKKSAKTSDKPHYPYELPKGWVWTTVGETCETHLGKMLDKLKNEGCYMSYLRNINVRWGCFDLTDVLKMRFKDDEVERYMIEKGDLVLCEGGEPGRCAIWDKANPIMFQKALHRIRCYGGVLNEYLKYVIEDYAKANKLEEYYTGSTIKHLTGESLVSILFPLPPVKEQERIVQEIQRYLSLVAIIENNKENLLAAIKQAKSKVLDLAIHGKLVPQDPNDEPAIELLKRINPKAEIITDNGHYQKLPVGWTICKLKDICSKLVDGDHNPPKGTKETTEYLMLSAQNIVNDNIVYTNGVRYLNHDAFETSDKRTKVMQGDLLITIVGTLGRSCVFSDNKKITLQRSVACLTPLIYNHFLKYYMDSSSIQKYMTTNAKGTAQKGFYLNQLEQLPIMIPPLTEQQRIVARIEKIFARLDVIESAL